MKVWKVCVWCFLSILFTCSVSYATVFTGGQGDDPWDSDNYSWESPIHFDYEAYRNAGTPGNEGMVFDFF